MSGPALNPLANIATAVKGADATRSDSAPLSASGTEAADSGFARELQRQIDRDGKPASDAATSAPASPGKTDNGKATTNRTSADTAEDAKAKAPEDSQTPAPDVASLLGNLLLQSTGAATSTPSAPPAATAVADDTSARLPLSQDTLPPGDPALAALVAAGMPQSAPVVTLTPAAKETVPDGKTGAGLMAAGQQTGNTGLSLADSADRRPLPNEATLASQTPATAQPDATAKLAATSETAGKERDLTAETTPANTFANVHAAALANLRGEAPTQSPSPVPMHVATPAGSPGWPEEVGSRVSWMVGHDESHAQLTLTPPQLGKIEVSITVSGDQTSAQFVAATPAARELIEQSLPRLREVLEQSGINLGQTDVGTSSQSNNPGEGRRGNAWGGSRGSDEGATPRPVTQQWGRRGDGLVDTFA